MSDQWTTQVLQRFNQAFLSHDPTLLEELLTEDCVLEDTTPAPNGERHTGREACLEFWSKMVADERLQYEPEDLWTTPGRGVIRWRIHRGPTDSVRGVTLMRLRGGLIAESLSYVKGD